MRLTLEVLKDFKITKNGNFRKGRHYFHINTCSICDEIYLKSNATKYNYCGKSCHNKVRVHSEETRAKRSKIMMGRFTGENSPHWNPNLTDEERIINRDYPEYLEWREAVYDRDNHTCINCGQVGGTLNAHHLYSYNKYPELRTTLENGITLCETCHKNFHHQFGYGDNTETQLNKFLKEE